MTGPGHKPRRRWLWWMLSVLVLLVMTACGLWWLSTGEPDYWRVMDAEDSAVRQGGERFERRVASQLSRVRRADATWELRVDQRRVNQWLAARLPLWLANRGVDEQDRRMLRHPMVAIRDGYIEAAVKADLPELDSVIRLRYEPEKPEGGGPVRLVLRSIHAGRLPLPMDYVIQRVVEQAGSDAEARRAVEEALRRLRSIELTRSLEDGRRVSVVGVKLEDGEAILTCRTERAAVPSSE